MSSSSKVVLVTGGAGYVGSHACKALAQSGFHPVAVDNLVNGHDWAVRWGPLETGDICESEFLKALIQKYHPVAIMHFAAFAYVGESVNEPSKYYANNVNGSLRLLDACRTSGVDKFVFSSTCATYGVPDGVPITESQIQNPVNPYGSSKLMVERILNDYDLAYGLRSVSLRYFNAAGADSDGEIGEKHDPETHLIPLVLDAIAGTRSQITIFGDDYPTPDGTCVRDYIHVTDLADAHVKALEYLIKGGRTTALNLGTGSGYSVRQVIDTAERITGRSARSVVGERRQGDPPELVADVSRALNLLDWKPTHSSLDEIVQSAWAWHQKQAFEQKAAE